jgi:RNA polymerase-associated protein
MTDNILLYEHPLSSYAQKIKIALREKGVDFTVRLPEGLGSGRPNAEFAALNPRMEAPVLASGADRIFESTIILEYIEERWPEPALLPKTPGGRAFARLTEEVCDSQYEAVNWGFGEIHWFKRAEGPLGERLKRKAAEHTRVLQGWLANRLGAADWFGGCRFGWADVCVAPIVNRSVHYGLGPEPGSSLARWIERVGRRPSVAATFAEFDAAAAAVAESAARFAKSGLRREYRDHRLDWMLRSGGLEVVVVGMLDQTIRFSWPD